MLLFLGNISILKITHQRHVPSFSLPWWEAIALLLFIMLSFLLFTSSPFNIFFTEEPERYTNTDLKISLDVCVYMKQYPKKFVFWILRIFELFVRKVCKFFSERIRCFSLKISAKCFHVKTKILVDLLICISVPLKILICLKRHTFSIEHLQKSYLHRRFILTYIWITKLLKKLFREVH